MTETQYPLTIAALRVEQPMGVFYIVALSARVLLDVGYSDTLRADFVDGEQAYVLRGTQRALQRPRLLEIAAYINRRDAAFPNTIIIAANHKPSASEDFETHDIDASDEDLADTTSWVVRHYEGGRAEITIPSREKVAAIIDGQHRLFAFAEASIDRLNMQLVCAVFIDLPKPYQAQLFATINSTQRPVSKSLTYELFGYNVLDEEPEFWTPDKLAVFLTRKLGADEKSPLEGRVIIAPIHDEPRDDDLENDAKPWKVSTAAIVDGIIHLFSSNPNADSAIMLREPDKARSEKRMTRIALRSRTDKSPLREFYVESADALLYEAILNFLRACDEIFWQKAPKSSFIKKTVGIQALLDILRIIATEMIDAKSVKTIWFTDKLRPAENIDFTEDRFNASGSGRSRIRKAIQEAISQ